MVACGKRLDADLQRRHRFGERKVHQHFPRVDSTVAFGEASCPKSKGPLDWFMYFRIQNQRARLNP